MLGVHSATTITGAVERHHATAHMTDAPCPLAIIDGEGLAVELTRVALTHLQVAAVSAPAELRILIARGSPRRDDPRTAAAGLIQEAGRS